MPIIAITARRDGGLDGEALPAVTPEQRVTVMIHGYRYAPGTGDACPHRTLYALMPQRSGPRVVSWPRHLGLAHEGLGIGFGWQATGAIWRAYAAAGKAGDGLAGLVRTLRAQGSGPVDVVAHSLGARVALSALSGVAPGDIGRLVLMSAAEFAAPAAAALATPAGRAAGVLNVTSRENDLFDGLFELCLAAGLRGLGPTLGFGLAARNAVTVQIDSAAHRRVLAALGHRIEPPGRRICHWSAYLRPGLFPLYRAVLDGRLPLPVLQAALPADTAPRWSRLVLPLPPAPDVAH